MSTAIGAQRPGTYLATMRWAEGLTHAEVARMLRMLRLVGFNRIWPSAQAIPEMLEKIEADHMVPTPDQLLSLRLTFPFSVRQYWRLCSVEQPKVEAAR